MLLDGRTDPVCPAPQESILSMRCLIPLEAPTARPVEWFVSAIAGLTRGVEFTRNEAVYGWNGQYPGGFWVSRRDPCSSSGQIRDQSVAGRHRYCRIRNPRNL